VQEMANDLSERHAKGHDGQCSKGAELASEPAHARPSRRKQPEADREAANCANQPTNDLKDWKGTYHHDQHLSFALVT